MSEETIVGLLISLLILLVGGTLWIEIVKKRIKPKPKKENNQLIPASFDESNMELKPPADMPECGILPVFHDKANGVYVSFWQASPEQIEQIKEEGGVWLGVIASAHPPVFVTASKPITQQEKQS